MAAACRQFMPRLLRSVWPSIASFLPHGVGFPAVEAVLSLITLTLFFLGVMNLIGVIGWWYVTLIVLDDTTLTVRMPLASNAIPLQAIQDIQTERPMFGLLFNYGTLIIYSGRETERIDFVPDVESMAQALYPGKR